MTLDSVVKVGDTVCQLLNRKTGTIKHPESNKTERVFWKKGTVVFRDIKGKFRSETL